MFSDAQLIIVGAGFYGLTLAERSANIGIRSVVIDRRDHIGGNAHSYIDADTGIEVHQYGSHLFHCNSEEVWNYVNKFSSFSDYRHRVYTISKGRVFPMPINLETICLFNNRIMSPSDARIWIDAHTEGQTSDAKNLEQKAISLIGRPLYEAFIRGYTIKQWQTDPRNLPASIVTRLPVRLHFDTRYFNDRFEGLPLKGYHGFFQSMIDSPLIKVLNNLDFFDIRSAIPPNIPVIYTGPIDRYFDYSEGALSWRTLDFSREVHNVQDFQGTSVMNYADETVPFTRIHEFRHLHPERTYREDKTILFKEFSRFAGRNDEPYYPIDTIEDKKTFLAYRDRSREERNVIFGGRLGTYRYLDMHQAIGAALNEFEKTIKPHFIDGQPLKRGSL